MMKSLYFLLALSLVLHTGCFWHDLDDAASGEPLSSDEAAYKTFSFLSEKGDTGISIKSMVPYRNNWNISVVTDHAEYYLSVGDKVRIISSSAFEAGIDDADDKKDKGSIHDDSKKILNSTDAREACIENGGFISSYCNGEHVIIDENTSCCMGPLYGAVQGSYKESLVGAVGADCGSRGGHVVEQAEECDGEIMMDDETICCIEYSDLFCDDDSDCDLILPEISGCRPESLCMMGECVLACKLDVPCAVDSDCSSDKTGKGSSVCLDSVCFEVFR